MGRARFLCCLPARLGVVIFSFCDFALSGIIAGGLWATLIRNHETHTISISWKVMAAVIAVASISTVVCLASIFGFFGALFKRTGGVKFYARTMAWILSVQIALSILYFVLIFTESTADFVKECQSQLNGTETQSWCQDHIKALKGITVAGVVIDLLLTAWVVWVSAAYASELEQTGNRNIILGNTNSASKYIPVGDEDPAFTRPNVSYPYADASHSYGHHQGGSYA